MAEIEIVSTTGERIVRCRNCAYECDGGTGCMFWSYQPSAWSKPIPAETEPNAFCSFGVER